MAPPSGLALRSVCLLALIALVQATYLIDDFNLTAIQYSSNPAGPVRGPFSATNGLTLTFTFLNGTSVTVDPTPCYNRTFTSCKTTDNCKLQFSFTGSGITFYVLRALAQGISARITIDDKPAITQTIDAPPGPEHYQSNFSFYDIQSLPSRNHTFSLLVLDWNGAISGMMFDYAAVNETFVAPPPISSSITSTSVSSAVASHSPSSSATATTTTSSRRPNTDTIAGVVIALAAAVLIIVLAVLYYRRWQRNNQTTARPTIDDSDHARDMQYSVVPFTAVAQSVGAATPSPHGRPTGPTSSSTLLRPSTTDLVPSNASYAGDARLLSSKATGTPPPPADLPVTLDTSSCITDEQVDFVRGLHAHNVPIPAIARVLQRMANTDLVDDERPPEYDAAH